MHCIHLSISSKFLPDQLLLTWAYHICTAWLHLASTVTPFKPDDGTEIKPIKGMADRGDGVYCVVSPDSTSFISPKPHVVVPRRLNGASSNALIYFNTPALNSQPYISSLYIEWSMLYRDGWFSQPGTASARFDLFVPIRGRAGHCRESSSGFIVLNFNS